MPFALNVCLDVSPNRACLSQQCPNAVGNRCTRILVGYGKGEAHRKIKHANHQEVFYLPVFTLIKASGMPQLAAHPKTEHLAVVSLCFHQFGDLQWDHQIVEANPGSS